MAGITLKSLAARLGVHPSLISRVLRNDPKARLSDKRRREILAAVKESGYRPDHAGQALRNRRSSIVALAIPDIANSFYAVLFRAVEAAALEQNYSVVLCNTDEKEQAFRRLFDTLGAGHIDGWLVATGRGSDNYLDLLESANIPYLLLNRRSTRPGGSWVGPDDFQTGRIVAEHLLNQGHRRIGYISAELGIESMRRRFDGFIETLRARGADLPDDLVIAGSVNRTWIRARTANLLKVPADRRPTALFVSNSQSLSWVLATIRDLDLRIPHDLSIVSYSPFSDPDVTSVVVPVNDMGRIGTEWLIAAITGATGAAKTPIEIVLPVAFVDRGTTAPIAR